MDDLAGRRWLMSRKRNDALAAGLMLAIVAIAGACHDGDVVTSSESLMTLSADPSRVVFPVGDATPIPVDLTAQVRSVDGDPRQGAAVSFTATAGVLSSAGRPVDTDSNGVARDVLTVPYDAPSTIKVTATSGSLAKRIMIGVQKQTPPAAATIRLVPSAPSYRVGDDVGVEVRIENGTKVGSVAFHLRYSTQTLEFVPPAIEGPYLGSDGTPTAFLAGDVAGGGELVASMSRLGSGDGVSGSGLLATFTFRAVGAGDAGFGFSDATVKDGQARNLPSSFVAASVEILP
jgi:hypothetical protein